MLIQAESRSGTCETITIERVKEVLEQDFNIPAEQIALAAYEHDDLAGVDVLSPTCPYRFVVTVAKLPEGWDCPFAYVLFSVAESRSATAVEQILGRILRLPYVRRKENERLNRAYAFAASGNFVETANSLVEGLVQNGFERFHAREMIRQRQPQQEELGPLFTPPTDASTVALPPLPKEAWATLPADVQQRLRQQDSSTVFVGRMSETDRNALASVYTDERDRAALAEAYLEARVEAGRAESDLALAPSERGVQFSVPLLAYQQGELLEPFEASHFLDRPWQLSGCDVVLDEALFPTQQAGGQQFEIDVSKDQQIQYRFLQQVQNQLHLLARDQGWTETDLIVWLDRQIPHPDIPIAESQAFITAVVQHLQRQRNISLDRLLHDKYRLRNAIAEKINQHRRAVHEAAYQELLLDSSSLVVTPDFVFTYDPHAYPVNRPYRGSYRFSKHYYPEIGDFDSDEERECAQFLDTLAEVETWVRNPTRSAKAFWLQTASDKFYPDFVCRLRDGRSFVVEYKGKAYRTNDDSVEKNTIGALWERRSGGRGLFLMVSDRQFEQIRARI